MNFLKFSKKQMTDIVIAGGLGYFLGGICESTMGYFRTRMWSIVEIPVDKAPKLYYSILEKIKLLKNFTVIAEDDDSSVTFSPGKGKYDVQYNNHYITIEIKEGKMILSIFNGFFSWFIQNNSIDVLKEFSTSSYESFFVKEKINIFYLPSIKNDSWAMPIFRKACVMKEKYYTQSMKEVLEDVESFKNSESFYESRGIPYKRGYFLEGETGTGKSTLIQIISTLYGMEVYLVNINSSMTDSNLISLLSQVQSNSIIVFEEFEKQLACVGKNKNCNISDGGILSSIDGPQRLAHGCLIFMNVNSSTGINEAFFRKGRLDKKFLFTEKLSFD